MPTPRQALANYAAGNRPLSSPQKRPMVGPGISGPLSGDEGPIGTSSAGGPEPNAQASASSRGGGTIAPGGGGGGHTGGTGGGGGIIGGPARISPQETMPVTDPNAVPYQSVNEPGYAPTVGAYSSAARPSVPPPADAQPATFNMMDLVRTAMATPVPPVPPPPPQRKPEEQQPAEQPTY